MELVCKGDILGGALSTRVEAAGRGGAGTCPLVTLVQKQLRTGASRTVCPSFLQTLRAGAGAGGGGGWYGRKPFAAFPAMLFAAEMNLKLQSEWQHLPQPRAKPALK